MCLEGNTKGVVDLPFYKEVSVGLNHFVNQPSQQKPGIEMGLYQQNMPARTKGNRGNGTKEDHQLLRPADQTGDLFGCKQALLIQDKRRNLMGIQRSLWGAATPTTCLEGIGPGGLELPPPTF